MRIGREPFFDGKSERNAPAPVTQSNRREKKGSYNSAEGGEETLEAALLVSV